MILNDINNNDANGDKDVKGKKDFIKRTCIYCSQCRELTEKEDVEENNEMVFDCIFCNQAPLSATVRKYFKCNHIMCKHCFAKHQKFECPLCRDKHNG